MKLSENQTKFCDYYISTGNASESYKKAYVNCIKDSVARANSSRLLTKANIISYIKEKNDSIKDDRIADMKEVKEFWTNVLRNEKVEMKDRLKASEFIGKTNAAFTEKIEHFGEVEINNPYKDLTVEELKKLIGK